MESLGLLEIILVIAISMGSVAVIAFGFWMLSTRGLTHQFGRAENIAPTFLFDGDALRDATPDAHLLIKDAPSHMTEKQSVIHVLGARFPTLDRTIKQLGHNETQTLHATDNSAISLEVSEIDGLMQLKLRGTCTQDTLNISEIAAQDALVSELTMLRNLTDQSPHLIWQQGADGQLNWANASYLSLSDALSGNEEKAVQSWPSEAIFPDLHLDAQNGKPKTRRISLDIPSQSGEAWFEVTTLKNGPNALHFANNANATVSAEYAKRQSVQTFGRIFAHLSTGLAIFDQERRLSMFNPALIEMTGLSPEFLSNKPTIEMFLDHLREARLLPEPKDYIKWREQFSLGDATQNEKSYCENWDIADGQTFKVSGQPNRDKTYAFFFEDISADVSLTRRFRSDIETGQGVLDTLPEAIAVFSANGTLVMSNRAYTKLWGVDHETLVRNHDLRAEMLMWQSHCTGSQIWGGLRDFIARSGERTIWKDSAVMDDGRQFMCNAQPMPGGMTMITFTTTSRLQSMIHKKLTTADPSIYSMKG